MKISFGFKLVVAFVIMLFCISTGIGIYALINMNTYNSVVRNEELAGKMNLCRELLEKEYPGAWRIEGDRLYKGDTLFDENLQFIKKLGKLTGYDIMFYKGTTLVASEFNAGQASGQALDSNIINTLKANPHKQIITTGTGYLKAFKEETGIGVLPIQGVDGANLGFWAIKPPAYKVHALAQTMQFRLMVGAYLAMLVTGVIFFLLTKIISRPIGSILKGMTRAESGDLTTRLEITTNDEFAYLGEKFNSMIENISQLIKNTVLVAEKVAHFSQQLDGIAADSSRATAEITATVQMVASGTEDQAKNIEQTSTIITQMSAGIEQVAAHAHSVLEIARMTSIKATDGAENVRNTIQQMNNINETVNSTADSVRVLGEKSKHIGFIVDVITGIAKQTNLLALNAAIEAARAGEQGRGFAVVAEEVRKLAEQSGEAAKEISNLIREIQHETVIVVENMEAGITEVDNGTRVVNEAGKSFYQIVDSINLVTDRIQEVSTATEQMSAGAQEAVNSVHNVASIAEETAASAEEVAAASQQQAASIEEVSASASLLAGLADDLKKMVTNFKV